MLEIRNTIKE